MKKIIYSLLLISSLFSCQKNQYTLQGDVSSLISEGVCIDSLSLIGDTAKIGQTIVPTNGKFCVTGIVEKPVFADLHIFYRYDDPENEKTKGLTFTHLIPVVLEPGELNVGKDESKNLTLITGTPLNDAISVTMKGFLQKKEENKDAEANQLLCDHVLAHKDDVSSVFMLQMAMSMLPEEEVLQLINQCSEEVLQYQCISGVKNRIEKSINAPKEGNMFTDFEVEYEGKITRLSDYVGKGQYVLVDFWASWCQPCRKEIPNLIAAYNQYREKGLLVLGVAAWDQPENTLKAIAEDGITYPQILNTQAIATDAYGIQGIPEIILFAPDGTMLKRGLRGAAIAETLSEIFDK